MLEQLPTIDYRTVKELQGNLKDLTGANYKKLLNSLKKYGFIVPLFIWKHNNETYFIDGHQRNRVLLKENIKPYELPYIEIQAATEKEAKEKLLVISSQYGKVTREGFDSFTFDLDTDFVTDFTYFDALNFELSTDNTGGQAEVKEDDYEMPEEIKTDIVRGDLFEIGEHRLLCGDSTDSEQVAKLMNGEKADMVFTDPPYGVNYEQTNAAKSSRSRSRSRSKIEGDNQSINEISETLWKPSFENLYNVSKDDCAFYMTMCQGGDQMMMMMMMSAYWQVKHELIWVKSSPVFSMGRLDYDYQHEPIIYGWKKKHNFYGKGKFLKSVWNIPKPSKSELHPTTKPIELIENMLLNSSLKNNIIIDLFLGSGSTMVAAHQLNRKCYGMELDPKYCQVIIDRMKKLAPDIIIKKNGVII